MPEFFLELFSEEIPARMQKVAAEELKRRCLHALQFLQPEKPHASHSARRITFSATIDADDGARKTDMAEARGPREGAPEAAVEGFLKKFGGQRDNLVVERGYYILRRALQAKSASETIKDDLATVLKQFPWQKSMRWGGSGDFSWIRPLRGIICLLDATVVPLVLGPIVAGNETEGHRFPGSRKLPVTSQADWKSKLRENFVVADQDERRQQILDDLKAKALQRGLHVVEDVELLDEVTGLVEWPVALIGKIDHEFMTLPKEVRELSMKVNQKYFALRDAEGQSAPYFAFVANQEAPDGGASIVAGNERVLRARLSDARHFWDLDLKSPLNELLPKLDGVVFHAKIGTQRARADRIANLARLIADQLDADGDEAKQAEWAGLLCKADLVTGMVGEFPELQGIMGGYYAAQTWRGWNGTIVGPAIRTHYLPKGPTDAVPAGTVAVSVALADKIDTLREFFRIGETPSGSGDPYALRRAALGVIRIILENGLVLPLKPLLADYANLFDFIIERLRVKLRGEGQRYDVLDAVLGAGGDDDLVRVMQRVAAVAGFLSTSDGTNLLIAYRRAANILKIEDAKDGPHVGELREDFTLLQEQELAVALQETRGEVVAMLEAGRFDDALKALARLREPVDEFFTVVTVNAPEPQIRLNRLRLLAVLRDTMHRIADFSRIEG